MNLKTASLVAAIGSSIGTAIYIQCFINIFRYFIERHEYGPSIPDLVFQFGQIAFPACLSVFFFTLWRKQK